MIRRFAIVASVASNVLFGGLVGCQEERGPGVMVHLGTDLPISAFDSVALSGRSKTRDSRTHVVAWIADASFEVLDPGGDDVEVTVALLDGANTVLSSRRGIDQFTPGTMTHAWMFLAAACESFHKPTCPEGQVCGRCGCEDFMLPIHEAAPWDEACSADPPPPEPPPPPPPNPEPQIADAGVIDEDAGELLPLPTDAGVVDGGASPCVPGTSTANRSYRARAQTSLEIGAQAMFALPPPMVLDFWVRFTAEPDGTELLAARNADVSWSLYLGGYYPAGALTFELERGPSQTTQMQCGTWPNDQQWHHVALQTAIDYGEIEISLYLDGSRCGEHDETVPWSIDSTALEIPAGYEDPNMLVDALHLRVEAPYDQTFTPVRVPAPTDSTVGLWLMDEEDTSTVAHDAACQNNARVEANSFSDDFPR